MPSRRIRLPAFAKATLRFIVRNVIVPLWLTLRLIAYVRVGWLIKFCGLVAFAAVLSPAFFRIAWTYYTSRRVKRDILYGSSPRNRLDLYLPEGCHYDASAVDDKSGTSPGTAGGDANDAGDESGGRPVIVFVTGGMWIIGYKAWGALLSLTLMKQGFIVASLDYRNFPQGTVGDMTQDVSNGIGWVAKRARSFGGDAKKIFVVGQSAGAHLASSAILRQAEYETSLGGSVIDYGTAVARWSPRDLAGFVGISGVYAPDDRALAEHFNRKGLHKEVFWSIMEAGYSGARAEEALPRASPCAMLRDIPGVASSLPAVLLCHGNADGSAPPSESARFAEALRAAGSQARSIIHWFPYDRVRVVNAVP